MSRFLVFLAISIFVLNSFIEMYIKCRDKLAEQKAMQAMTYQKIMKENEVLKERLEIIRQADEINYFSIARIGYYIPLQVNAKRHSEILMALPIMAPRFLRWCSRKQI